MKSMDSTKSCQPFSEKQEMLAIAFFADITSGLTIKKVGDTEKATKESIDNILKSEYGHKMLGDWELVYAPAILTKKVNPQIGDFQIAINTTVIFYNSSKKHLAIGVAGTNMISVYDWFEEDFKVGTLVPWNSGVLTEGSKNTGKAVGGYISTSTSIAIKNTWNTANSTKQTPIEWLKNTLSAGTLEVEQLIVTGHSLGGAIAPTLAMALVDNPLTWNVNRQPIEVLTYTFAGPTPGDVGFRDYVESKMSVHSVVNCFDVVPHTWEIDLMEKLKSLYADRLKPGTATCRNKGILLYWVIEAFIAQSKLAKDHGHDYERWNNEFKFSGSIKKNKCGISLITGGLYKKLSCKGKASLLEITGLKPKNKLKRDTYLKYFLDYFIHLGNQHVSAYQDLFECPEFLKALKKTPAKDKDIDKALAINVLDHLLIYTAKYYEQVHHKANGVWYHLGE